MIKAYLNVAGMVVFMCACWGFIAPPMISAKDTVTCLLGLAILIAAPAVTGIWAKKVFMGDKNVDKLKK